MENMMQYLKDIDKEKLKTVLEIKEAYNGGRMSLEEAKRILKEKVKKLNLSNGQVKVYDKGFRFSCSRASARS